MNSNKENEEIQKKLRHAKVFLIGGVALAVTLLFLGLSPYFSLLAFLVCVAKTVFLVLEVVQKRIAAAKALGQEVGAPYSHPSSASNRSFRKESDEDDESALDQETVLRRQQEFKGVLSELKQTAGIELFHDMGRMGSQIVYAFAYKAEQWFEFEGVAGDQIKVSDGLIINGLHYLPIKIDRMALALTYKHQADLENIALLAKQKSEEQKGVTDEKVEND